MSSGALRQPDRVRLARLQGGAYAGSMAHLSELLTAAPRIEVIGAISRIPR